MVEVTGVTRITGYRRIKFPVLESECNGKELYVNSLVHWMKNFGDQNPNEVSLRDCRRWLGGMVNGGKEAGYDFNLVPISERKIKAPDYFLTINPKERIITLRHIEEGLGKVAESAISGLTGMYRLDKRIIAPSEDTSGSVRDSKFLGVLYRTPGIRNA